LQPHTCSTTTPAHGALLSPSFVADELLSHRPAIFDSSVAGPSSARATPKANGAASRKGKGKEIATDSVASASTSVNGTPKAKAKALPEDGGDVEMTDGDAASKKRPRPSTILSPDKPADSKREDSNGTAKKPRSLGTASASSKPASPLASSEKSAKPKSSDRERDQESASDAPKKKRKVDEGQSDKDKDAKRKDIVREGTNDKAAKGASVTSDAATSRKPSAASDNTVPSAKKGGKKSLIEVKKERKEAEEQGVGIWREHSGQVG
jgi:hypothetical protein